MPERFIPITEFTPAPVRETLGAESRSIRDVAHGNGEVFSLGQEKAKLEIYPAAAVARVTTEHARVELFRVPGYRLTDAAHVIFELGGETDRLRLLVGSEGAVSLRPVVRAPGSRTAAEASADDQLLHPTQFPALQRPTERQETPHDAQSETAQQESTTLTGRLGRDELAPVARTPPV